jgi:uncharacterized protein YjbJ (UPF0337 family)
VGEKKRRGYGQSQGQDEQAAGSLTGDKHKKSEGRSDQRSDTAKEKKGKLKDLVKQGELITASRQAGVLISWAPALPPL